MKLSEAKRRVKVGTVIEAVGHYNPKATGTRVVTKVQTNGFWYQCDQMPSAWCPWPPASRTVDIATNEILLLTDQRAPMSTLKFTEEA